MTKTNVPPQIPSRFNHFAHLEPYCFNNSFAGLKKGRELGYRAIDLDQQITKDGIVISTHWGDTREFEKKRRKFKNLTWREVSKLRSTDGGYRIHTFNAMARQAKKLGYTRIEFEAKGSKGFAESPEIFKRVKQIATSVKINVQVKTISTIPGAPKRLTNAHNAGLTTILLPRGLKICSLSKYGDVTTYVRGKVRWRA